MDIDNQRDLSDLARVLMSQGNRQFGRAVEVLCIEDDPEARYTHTLPSHLPGPFLPNMKALNFSQLDWTTDSTRPHASFFTWLSYFESVTNLDLEDCRFRHIEDLHSIAIALSNLEQLSVDTSLVEVSRSITEDAERRPPISRVNVAQEVDIGHDVVSIGTLDTRPPLHSTVVCLYVSTTLYHSFAQLQRFLEAFPALRELLLRDEPPWSVPRASTGVALLPTDTTMHVWPMLALHMMSAEVLLRFIELFGSQYPRIREVNLSLRGTMSSALHHVIEELARSSGPDLESFSWDSCRDKETLMQSSPRVSPFLYTLSYHSIIKYPCSSTSHVRFPLSPKTSICGRCASSRPCLRGKGYLGSTEILPSCSRRSRARTCRT